MKRIIILLTVLGGMFLSSPQIQAQSFVEGFFKGLADGANIVARQLLQQQLQQQQQQRGNSNSFSYGNSSATNVMRDNSFSLANTSATTLKREIKEFSDGSSFYGFLTSRNGVMTYADGKRSHGQFDSNWNEQGLCYIEFPDGSTYYGFFEGGIENGEGSIYTDGEYHDVVFRAGEMVSAIKVKNPKFDKEEYDKIYENHVRDVWRQQQEFEINTNTNYSSGNSSSSRSRSADAERIKKINRQADATAKSYEYMKKNPSATSHMKYQSDKKLLNTLQGKRR